MKPLNLEMLKFFNMYCSTSHFTRAYLSPSARIPLSMLHEILMDDSLDKLISLLLSLPVDTPINPKSLSSFNLSQEPASAILFMQCVSVISLVKRNDIKSAELLLDSYDYRKVMSSIISFLIAYVKDIDD